MVNRVHGVDSVHRVDGVPRDAGSRLMHRVDWVDRTWRVHRVDGVPRDAGSRPMHRVHRTRWMHRMRLVYRRNGGQGEDHPGCHHAECNPELSHHASIRLSKHNTPPVL